MGLFTWSYSLPVSDTKDYITNDSWIGMTLEGRRWIRPNVTASLSIGFTEFYENTDKLISVENGDVSGQQYRNLQMIPIMAGVQRYFGEERGSRPYIGLTAGAHYTDQLLDIGLYTVKSDNWHFSIAPEFGVVIPALFGGQGQNVIGVRYTYPFEAGNYLGGQKRSWSHVSIFFGFAWHGN
jgi:hypothetical protein